ncbi:MAG: hypothetical protein CMG02_01030 [Candidatus Marinimicrobia bacterium]|nr:hypothetical protein [Candidatus Neomarinimicrobiota bacterium]RPG05168.1 MAG: hypothetical protein CBE07_002425 [Pelagibacteraceae bacterium TMED247]|tara:strand:+ start:2301 stop:3686 length:1386 start_codon:yes stop_codon:yes gene_type:complete
MGDNTSKKIFFYFLISHLIFWTLVPSLTNNNLPRDTIEALAWGSNLDWGFDKHPPLSAFAVEIFYKIFGNQDWAYYFLSQIFVILTFFVVWVFSRELFKNDKYALISVLLLESIYFYNFTTPEFNVNVCQLPFWALAVFYCWKGFKNNKINDWLLFGLFAGFGVLSKYLFIYLLCGIDLFLIYMLIKKKIDLKCLVSLFSFLLILIPHLVWLIENDYITIFYGIHRTSAEFYVGSQSFLNHIEYPVIFLIKQIAILCPFFLLLLFVVKKFKNRLNLNDEKLIFLISINLVPIALVLLTSLLIGIKIRTMWMTPFYLFFGVFALYIFRKNLDFKKIKNFYVIFLILFFISPLVYSINSLSKKNQRIDYPAKEISKVVEKSWNKNFKNTIDIVVGQSWWAGNLSYHLKTRPKYIRGYLDFVSKEIGPNEGIVYIENEKSKLTKVCPGVYFVMHKMYICMVGTK